MWGGSDDGGCIIDEFELVVRVDCRNLASSSRRIRLLLSDSPPNDDVGPPGNGGGGGGIMLLVPVLNNWSDFVGFLLFGMLFVDGGRGDE